VWIFWYNGSEGRREWKKDSRKASVIEGKYILSYKPKNKLSATEYLKTQGRFTHMFKPGNEWMIEQVQAEVDRKWEELLKLCELQAIL